MRTKPLKGEKKEIESPAEYIPFPEEVGDTDVILPSDNRPFLYRLSQFNPEKGTWTDIANDIDYNEARAKIKKMVDSGADGKYLHSFRILGND